MINKYPVGIILLFFAIITINNCKSDSNNDKPHLDESKIKESFIQINKAYIDVEDRQIDDYLNRRNWNFERTQSGLRYLIYQKGVGKPINTESIVRIDYTISLIRGEIVYSSGELGSKIIVIDKSEEPSGLHEALHLLKVGDRAKLVIPSYLAYGLLGDEKKIPPKATLFYDIIVREVK